MDFNDVKCTVRSILTSSKDPVSVEKFRRLFCKHEGMNVPYKSLGFNSDIELLQNMPDVLTLPENPNSSSFMCLILNEKTYHMRMLVIKQKQKKKRKENSIKYGAVPHKYQNLSNSLKIILTRYFDNDNNRISPSSSILDINEMQNEPDRYSNLMDELQANLGPNIFQNQ